MAGWPRVRPRDGPRRSGGGTPDRGGSATAARRAGGPARIQGLTNTQPRPPRSVGRALFAVEARTRHLCHLAWSAFPLAAARLIAPGMLSRRSSGVGREPVAGRGGAPLPVCSEGDEDACFNEGVLPLVGAHVV